MHRNGTAGWLMAVVGLALASPVTAEEAPADNATEDQLIVTHLTAETVAESGRTRVIHFAVSPAVSGERALAASVADPGILEIARPATAMEGHTYGTIRVKGLEHGETTLVIGEGTIGEASLLVKVVPPRGSIGSGIETPHIVGPVSGAVIWGRISVGVELRLRPGQPLSHVMLYAGEQMALFPKEDTRDSNQPYRQLRFEIDTDTLPEGLLDLQPVAMDDMGVERPGPVVRVRIQRPTKDRLTAGEAEWRYDIEGAVPFGGDQVTIQKDATASGGLYADNDAPFPAVAFPVVVEWPGWYQAIVVGRGTRAQDALPLIGMFLDGTFNPVTNGRLLSEDWHRVAIGVPFRLEAGRHVVTPYFSNDFNVTGLTDRNLHLDRIEVARVSVVDLMESGPGASRRIELATDAGPAAVRSTIEDPHGVTTAPLRVAFTPRPRTDDIPALVEINASTWSAPTEDGRPPQVTALINGRMLQTQRSRSPRFWIDPTHFDEGVNRVQLMARSDHGPVAFTPVCEVPWEAGDAGDAAADARRTYRFTVHDEAWRLRKRLEDRPDAPEGRVAAFNTRGAVTLNLPEDLGGTFDVYLDGWGHAGDKRPEVSLATLGRGGRKEAGRVEVEPGWRVQRLAGLTVTPGPNRLMLRLDSRFGNGNADPVFLLQSLIFVESGGETDNKSDNAPPTIALSYPPPGATPHEAYMADAIVATATDNTSVDRAELLIDGEPTGQTVRMSFPPEPIVLPLLLRSLTPGTHAVSVRVTDVAGNTTVSDERAINVLDTRPSRPGQYTRAVRLLNRFAYGPDHQALAAILTLGEEAWLTQTLLASADDPAELAALGRGYTLFPTLDPASVTGRVVSHQLLTPNPARARFLLWVENHFSTWIRKIGGGSKWNEHLTFSRLGAAPFDRLLFASAESPAMLVYLDQIRSAVGQLNENYAREIMELHTLGVDGGYAQSDVTNLAHLLTGWTASLDGDGRSAGAAAQRYTFRFDPDLNDSGATQVFGSAYAEAEADAAYDRAVLAVEQLAFHPATARHIMRKLAEHYVSVPAPDDLVDELTTKFLATAGDMEALLATVVAYDLSLGDEAPGRVARPLDYVLRLYRTCGHYAPGEAVRFLQISGKGLYDCPTPDGYPEDDGSYVDSNALIQRWKLARSVSGPLAGLVPAAWYDRGVFEDGAWEQAVVDVIAVRLTGQVLSTQSNKAALDVLAAAEGSTGERFGIVAPFIAQLPEANLR